MVWRADGLHPVGVPVRAPKVFEAIVLPESVPVAVRMTEPAVLERKKTVLPLRKTPAVEAVLSVTATVGTDPTIRVPEIAMGPLLPAASPRVCCQK